MAIYLAVMAWIGYPSYKSGIYSATYYFGLIALTALTIVLLHFSLKRHERNRRNRN